MARALLAFEPPDGGVPANVAQLALGLPAHGWEIEVAGPLQASIYGQLERAGVPVHRLPLVREHAAPGADLGSLAGLRRLLAPGRFDLVHLHAAKAGVLGRVAAASSGTPSLYSPHCFAFDSGLAPAWRLVSAVTERALRATGGSLLCVCEHERQLALAHALAPPDRVHVVYNGCESPPVGIEPDNTVSGMRERGPVAGAVAAMRAQKHLDLLIDAAPLVLAELHDASVVIVGDGPLRPDLEARAGAAGLDTEERFAIVGFTPPAARALSALDVYVLPSAWESFPIGVLEAMACGVPQVVTDVGGNGEAVTPETGLIVAPEDPVALAGAMIELLRDPERRAQAAKASRRRHAQMFGLERMVEETAAVYERIARVG